MKKEKNLILISSMAILLTALLECIVIVMKPNLIAIIAIGVCMLINVFILLTNILHIVEERHEEHLQEEAQLISQLQMLSKKIDRRLELLERVGKANYTATNRIREAQTNCFSVTNSLLDEVKHNQFQTAQLIAKYNTVAHNKNLEDRHRQMASLLKCLDKNLENLSIGEIAPPPALPDFNVDFTPVIDTLENGFITVGERLEQLQQAGLAPSPKPAPKAAVKSKPAVKSGTKPKTAPAVKPDLKPDIKPEPNIVSELGVKPEPVPTPVPEPVPTPVSTSVPEPVPTPVPEPDISEQAEHLAAALETMPQISVVPDEPVIEYIPEPEPDIMPEPVPIPVAKPEAAPASSDDAGHIMTPDEIAALLSAPAGKPEPEPVMASSDDDGHIMTPDEIAALLSAPAGKPEPVPEPAPAIEEIPVPELKPLDEDPNRSLTADEIAALFSNA